MLPPLLEGAALPHKSKLVFFLAGPNIHGEWGPEQFRSVFRAICSDCGSCAVNALAEKLRRLVRGPCVWRCGAAQTQAVRRVVEPEGSGADALIVAAELFQSKIRSAECTARWVDAAFWAAARSVCDLGALGDCAGSPLVLLGDALCGKPFYTGTTLNGHLKDVAAMVDEASRVRLGGAG